MNFLINIPVNSVNSFQKRIFLVYNLFNDLDVKLMLVLSDI